MVCLRPEYVFLFSSLIEDGEGISAGSTDVGYCAFADLQLSVSLKISSSRCSTEGFSFPSRGAYKVLVGKSKKGGHLEVLGIGGRMTIKWIFKK